VPLPAASIAPIALTAVINSRLVREIRRKRAANAS
jgi:hypothetical protein